MIRLSSLLVLWIFSHIAVAQSIDQAEYFFDVDPGVGMATPISITASGTLDEQFTLPTAGLADGIHYVHIRTRTSDGFWSLYGKRVFQVIGSGVESTSIERAEYFFDVDPNIGQGDAITITASSEINEQATIGNATLSEVGLHQVNIRVMDSNGIWSHYEKRQISVIPIPLSDQIIAYEYSIDAPIGPSNSQVSVEPNEEVNLKEAINATSLTDGDHLLYARILTADGRYSFDESDTFTIASCAPPYTNDSSIRDVRIGQTDILDINDLILSQPSGNLTATIISNGNKGELSLSGALNANYTARVGTVGLDSITIDICSNCTACVQETLLFNIVNEAPQFLPMNFELSSDSILSVDVLDFVEDINDNLDPNSLNIDEPPTSNAPATISPVNRLVIDYTNTDFDGNDAATISICDDLGECSQQIVNVNVLPLESTDNVVVVYNAISGRQDQLNDLLFIENILNYPSNRIRIYDRWGNLVFELEQYDNDQRAFRGQANVNNNNDLPSGTYYYELALGTSQEILKGYLLLKQ